jgi:hypothetical protein
MAFFLCSQKVRKHGVFVSVTVQKAPRSKRSKIFRTRPKNPGFWGFFPKMPKK